MIAIFLILAVLMPFNGILYQETLYQVYEHPIELIVVERETDMPKVCWEDNSMHMITAGCSVIDYHDDKPNTIYLLITRLQTKDPYGLTSIYHEILHIKCQCNWHGG